MRNESYETSIFINCPFDKEYEPLLEAAIFCCVYLGFHPQLASARLEAGEVRLGKIVSLIGKSKFSIHDLSRPKASRKGEALRMNMPFELGLDMGFRLGGQRKHRDKRFLIFEKQRFDLKSALSDIAGQDVDQHEDSFEILIRKVRNFLKVEGGIEAPGSQRILADYETFQAWLLEKKLEEGHSEQEALDLPVRERIQEMQSWIDQGMPVPWFPK